MLMILISNSTSFEAVVLHQWWGVSGHIGQTRPREHSALFATEVSLPRLEDNIAAKRNSMMCRYFDW